MTKKSYVLQPAADGLTRNEKPAPVRQEHRLESAAAGLINLDMSDSHYNTSNNSLYWSINNKTTLRDKKLFVSNSMDA